MLEFTVFIIVKIPILKDVSKSIFDTVNKIVIKNRERTKINIDRKYLLISDMSVLESIKDRKHDKFYSAVIDTLPPVGSISTPNTSSFITLQRHFNAIEVGDELALWLPQALDSNGILVQDFTLNWKVGTKLLLQPADSTGSLPSTPITIESSTITAEVVSWDNGGVTPSGSWNHFTSDSTATGYPGLTNINNVNLFTPLVTVQQPVLDSVARVRIRINEIKSAPPVAGAGYPDPLQFLCIHILRSISFD